MSDTPIPQAPGPAKLAGPRGLLDRFGLRPKHSFGQNFLGDAQLAARIAELCAPTGRERVLELGAGLGALSEKLLARAPQVILLERDRDLVPALRELFLEPIAAGRARVVEADAKTADWLSLLGPERPRVVCGNLPYQITGPLLSKSVRLARDIDRAVFLIQREVADRLVAEPGTKQYGALSVFVQAQFSVRRALLLKPGAFHPPPRVDSAVCVLSPLEVPVAEETRAFRLLVKSAFAARRKTLRNAWKSLAPGAVLDAAARGAGVSLDARGETLSPGQFASVCALLEASWAPPSNELSGEGEEA